MIDENLPPHATEESCSESFSGSSSASGTGPPPHPCSSNPAASKEADAPLTEATDAPTAGAATTADSSATARTSPTSTPSSSEPSTASNAEHVRGYDDGWNDALKEVIHICERGSSPTADPPPVIRAVRILRQMTDASGTLLPNCHAILADHLGPRPGQRELPHIAATMESLPHVLVATAPSVDRMLEEYYRGTYLRMATQLDAVADEALAAACKRARRETIERCAKEAEDVATSHNGAAEVTACWFRSGANLSAYRIRRLAPPQDEDPKR